jgi:hypothetical protein
MKTLETNFNGGLRFNWDDLRWMQTGIKTVLDNIVKSLGNQEELFIVSGCETRNLIGDYGFYNVTYSSGILALNGELMNFSGFSQNSVHGTNKFWFTKEIVYDPTGVKIDKYNQLPHQCYAEAILEFHTGESLPSEGDYWEVSVEDKMFTTKDIYQILSEKLQRETTVATAVASSGWSISNYKFYVNGKFAMFSCEAEITSEGGLQVATLSVKPPIGTTVYGLGKLTDGYIIPLSLNANGVLSVESSGEIGATIKITLTYITA